MIKGKNFEINKNHVKRKCFFVMHLSPIISPNNYSFITNYACLHNKKHEYLKQIVRYQLCKGNFLNLHFIVIFEIKNEVLKSFDA